MKKILSAIMAVAMICTFAALFTSCGGSGEEFVIGITYFEPMNYFDENNKLTGFETEFAEAVCKKLGLTAKKPWASPLPTWQTSRFSLSRLKT